MSKNVLIGIAAALCLVHLAACGDKKKDAPAGGGGGGGAAPTAGAPEGAEVKLDSATAGSIKGTIKFGNQPSAMPKQLDMGDKTAECGTKDHPIVDEWYVVGENNAAANVLVFVKSGPAKNVKTPVPTAEAVLDQAKCMYTPRVLALRAGQPLRIKSSDNTSHNVHILPKANPEWNQTMAPMTSFVAGDSGTQKVTIPEIFKVKCDIHPWMGGTIGAFSHDAFAVTKKDGLYELKNLPPGEYEIEVRHERAKAKPQKVTLGAKETKTLDFVLNFED